MKIIRGVAIVLISLFLFITCSKDTEPEQTSSPDIIQNSNDENSEGDSEFEEIPSLSVIDISLESESNWDFWIIGKEEDSFYIKLKEDRPSQIHFIPAADEEGLTILFDASGLPSRIIVEDYILVFDNFSGSNYDVAIMQPDNSVNFIKNIESSINWESFQSKENSKQKFDWLKDSSLIMKALLCDFEFKFSFFSLEAIGPYCESFILSYAASVTDIEEDLIEPSLNDLVNDANFLIGCSKPGKVDCLIAFILNSKSIFERSIEYLQGLNDSIELTVVEMHSPSSAPTIPSQPWPIVDADLRGDVVNLAWTSIDPDQENLTFDLYFGTNTTPNLFTSGIDESTYRINSLESGKRYYWSIRAIDPEGNMVFGPVWYFDIVTINNDEDNDQVPDDEDECPNTPQGSIVDENGCVDENSSLDDDNDGVNNAYDECPDTPTGENVYSTGCSLSQKDDDKDGVSDNEDVCDDTPAGETVNENGCSESQLDEDNDGIVNSADLCPETGSGENTNMNGCSEAQLDDDLDGIFNDKDLCPDTSANEIVNTNGCSERQLDLDGDGVLNDNDQCPNTPQGESVTVSGCAQSQIDYDGDGVFEDSDICPNTPEGEAVDENGCTVTQTDEDNDGILNENDNCPGTPSGESVDENGCSNSVKTTIPDSIFENYLENHDSNGGIVNVGDSRSMGDGILGNGKVLKERLENVSVLTLNDLGISTLIGIEDFPNLRNLQCVNNNISDLDLSSNLKLWYLNGTNNQLTSINFGSNYEIKVIDLINNNLTSIDVSSYLNLESLHISDNSISSIDISNNPGLKSLKVNNLQLNNINISINTQLEILNARNTGLSDINLSNNQLIRVLQLDNNNINNLDLFGLSNLIELEVSENSLSDLIFENNVLLERIICVGNNLTNLDLSNLNNLDFINSSGNNIECIQVNQFQLQNKVNLWSKDSSTSYSINCSDADNDGVDDEFDLCPNTPENVSVDSSGCPEITSTNLLKNPSAESGTSDWVLYGDSGFEQFGSSNVFFTKDNVDDNAYLIQDVVIGSSNTNKYLLIIGNLNVENTVPSSITRHPYLYGIQMTATDQNVEYMQGQDMLHSAGAGVWQVGSGVFQIKENVEKIQLLLAQAIQVGDDPDGTKALYDDIELLIFDSMSEAIYYRDNVYNPTY